MPTLYRKYRPGTFEDVTGQETIVQTLSNEISMDRLSHAYLFSGPRGVGKTTMARLLAKSVSCEERKSGKFEPCNKCKACEQINNGRHIDIIEIDAASQTGVDNVRENIIENAGVMPTTLKYKIFIIDEVHMLSTSAFNALLKTLEEPPAHVIFILATTELHKLPATVISRCERFSFKRIPFDQMLARLKKICQEEKVKVDKEVLERIANKSDGGLRDAESLLGQILSLNLKEIKPEDIQMILPLSSSETILNYIDHIIEGNSGEAINLINSQAEEGVNLDQFAYDLIETLRVMLLIQMNASKNSIEADFREEDIKKLNKLSSQVGTGRIVRFIDLSLKRKTEIKSSPLPQLPLELLAVEATEMFSSPNPPTTQPTNEIKVEPKQTKEEVKKEESSTISHLTTSIKSAISHITHDTPISTTIDQIKSRWAEIVEKAGVLAPSLPIILKVCTVEELKGNVVVLGVPFTLHKEKLEGAKNRIMLEQCFEKVFSEKIRLTCVVLEQKKSNNDADVAALAAEFGGEVIG